RAEGAVSVGDTLARRAALAGAAPPGGVGGGGGGGGGGNRPSGPRIQELVSGRGDGREDDIMGGDAVMAGAAIARKQACAGCQMSEKAQEQSIERRGGQGWVEGAPVAWLVPGMRRDTWRWDLLVDGTTMKRGF